MAYEFLFFLLILGFGGNVVDTLKAVLMRRWDLVFYEI